MIVCKNDDNNLNISKMKPIEKEPFSLEHQIESLCDNGLRRGVIDEDSIMGSLIKQKMPNHSITEALEKILRPKYANTVFTWHQIITALKKRQF